MKKASLVELYQKHNGKISDKWSFYLTEYDRLFRDYRSKDICLLEIGIQNGGALELLANYFPDAQKFVGCDINAKCAGLTYVDQRILVVCGDAGEHLTFDKIKNVSSKFDIIIDDGSHSSSDIINNFMLYFNLVPDGGLYIVEDMHCSYWASFEGGLYDPYSSMAFFKRIADVINYEHWGVAKSETEPFQGIFDKYGISADVELFKHIHSVEFTNSMCIIRKQSPGTNKLGVRVVVGTVGPIDMEPLQVAGMLSHPPDQSENVWSTMAVPPEETILALQPQISNLQLQKSDLQLQISDLEAQISDLQAQLEHQLRKVDTLDAEIVSRTARANGTIFELTQQLSTARVAHENVTATLNAVTSSTTWRMTAGIRGAFNRYPGVARLGRRSLKLIWWMVTGQLASRLKARREILAEQGAEVSQPKENDVRPCSCTIRVIPSYISPADTECVPPATNASRIGVHFHLYYLDLLDEFISRFANIPFEFDLFVSTPDFILAEQLAQVEAALREGLPRAKKMIIKPVPNRGRDMGPFIVEFGKTLLEYDIVGHFHTKKSLHDKELRSWRDDILDLLLGPIGNSGGHVARIFAMLENNAKMVCAEIPPIIKLDATGWTANYGIAKEILKKYFMIEISDYPIVKFPEGSMIWARSAVLQKLLTMPISYSDFPPEPLPIDGSIAHALERLFFILAQDAEGDLVRLHKKDSVPDYSLYEDEQDFSERRVHHDVKVLSYYLPRFYPASENKRYGAGCTEWMKVRSANPLFVGHYQQHIPHPDVGYYSLDNPDVLRRQATDMRYSGVYGQIFYHYWFGGKLAFEKPAQILLDNADIDMPFCFCWATENLIQDWDGGEREVLRQLNCSQADARDFISYLIPFFRDERYIKVDQRPVLFINHPSDIQMFDIYLEIWAQECEVAGLPRPYIIATSRTGDADPREPRMDARAECMPAWTSGTVPEITGEMDMYAAFSGQVFSYEQIKEHSTARPAETAFACFRSLVPRWDDTALSGAAAHVVHGSSPQLFQEWLQGLISQSEHALESKQRFILVDAWNGWAEGAHLEADTRYGYAYLNAVGRALSNEPYCAPDPDAWKEHSRLVARSELLQKFFVPPKREAALFVTHSPDGRLKPHVQRYVSALAEAGIDVYLIVATDKPSQTEDFEDLRDVSGLFVRSNEGYDFAAWAHVLRKYPQFRAIDILYLINDSVIGPLQVGTLSTALARLRGGRSLIYGMTESLERCRHLQSYFLAIKQPALGSAVFNDFFLAVKSFENKQCIIDKYEITFSEIMEKAGFRTEGLFSVATEQNQTLFFWKELLQQGFPFVKIQAGRDPLPGIDREAIRKTLLDAGYSEACLDALLNERRLDYQGFAGDSVI